MAFFLLSDGVSRFLLSDGSSIFLLSPIPDVVIAGKVSIEWEITIGPIHYSPCESRLHYESERKPLHTSPAS